MDKVKKELEKNKNYDFSSETWTEEKLRILYDAIYTTEKIIKDELRQYDFRSRKHKSSS